MELYYKFTVSKGRIFFEQFRLLPFDIAIPFIICNSAKQKPLLHI